LQLVGLKKIYYSETGKVTMNQNIVKKKE